MANDPGPETQVSVSTGEVHVSKTFEADRFPVPAIAFEIESHADNPVDVRLVDHIPESFPMEGVGFHPDYDSDNWTAYRDHRVAYERTLEPGEEVLTVYGIRIDDPEEAEDFLGEPTIELVEPDDAAAGAGDILDRETTQVVRDALSGEESGDLSDLAPEPDSEPLLGDEAPEPRARDDDLTAAMGDRAEDVTAVDVEAEPSGTEEAESEEEEEAEEETEVVASADAAAALDPRSGGEADETDSDATATESTASDATPDSVAAALAAEIRAGTVADDDLDILRDAFEEAGGEVPTSVDVRVSRLQSQVEDMLAYRDALAEFLDESGTAEEVLEAVSEDVNALDDRVGSLEESVAAADSDREDLHDEVTALADTVAEVSDRVESVDDQLTGVETTVENFEERLSAVESLRSDIDDIHDELAELQTFRERLNSAFGPGE